MQYQRITNGPQSWLNHIPLFYKELRTERFRTMFKLKKQICNWVKAAAWLSGLWWSPIFWFCKALTRWKRPWVHLVLELEGF